MKTNLNNLVSTEVIATKLGYHVQYVRDLARAGKLPAIKRGRAWMFDEAQVLAHLEAQTVDAKKDTNYGRRATDDGSDLLR